MELKLLLRGNRLLIICCGFYLLWWLIAFNPRHAIKGNKSSVLLIPAFIFGLLGVIDIVKGSGAEGLFSRRAALAVGIALYFALLLLSSALLKRQVTTELLLIVGWTVLMSIELNALYALGVYEKPLTLLLLFVTFALLVAFLVCYMLYYNLDGVKGFIAGSIPLILAASLAGLFNLLA